MVINPANLSHFVYPGQIILAVNDSDTFFSEVFFLTLYLCMGGEGRRVYTCLHMRVKSTHPWSKECMDKG